LTLLNHTRRCVLTLLLAVLAPGCSTTGGLPLDEVTEQQIAFVYWDNEDALRRADILADIKAAEQGAGKLGVATVDAMQSLLGRNTQKSLAQIPGRIALLNPRTLELTRFPAAPPNARPLAWSPDHQKLLFSSQHRDGRTMQLYQYDLDSGELSKLTSGPAYHLEGDYGPSGDLVIAWIRMKGEQTFAGLNVTASSGGASESVMRGTYPSGLRWSPRGDVVAYVRADDRPKRADSRRDNSSIVVRAPVPGAEEDFLSRGREPVFTPDGEWIVFSAESSEGWKLRRMRPDGSARKSVGRSIRDERNPAVSPDGRHITYVSEDTGIARLYLRRIDGSGDRILLEDGSAAFPVW